MNCKIVERRVNSFLEPIWEGKESSRVCIMLSHQTPALSCTTFLHPLVLRKNISATEVLLSLTETLCDSVHHSFKLRLSSGLLLVFRLGLFVATVMNLVLLLPLVMVDESELGILGDGS